MAGVDEYLLAALGVRDAKASGVPAGSVLADCNRAFHSAVASRRRAAELERRLGDTGRKASWSGAAGDGGGGDSGDAEAARLKDRVIALQDKVGRYMEGKEAATERASAAEDRAREAERRAAGLEARLAETEAAAAEAGARGARDGEECEILRGEVKALRGRALRSEEEAGRLSRELDSLVGRFVAEKASAAAHMNELTEELHRLQAGGGGGGGAPLSPAEAAERAEEAATGADAELAASLVGGSSGPAQAAPSRLARRVASAHRGQVSACCYSPDGAVVAAAGVDGTVTLWDGVTLGRKGELRAATAAAAGGRVADASSSTLLCVDVLDGAVVAGSLDKTVRCWDLETGRVTHQLGGHTGRVLAVRAVADGRVVLSAAADRTLRLWDMRAHRAVRTIPTSSVPQCADVTGDGSYAVAGHLNKAVRVFDLTRGAVVAELGGAHAKPVLSVEYSRGDASARVLSYGQEGSWRVVAAATLGPLDGTADGAGGAAAAGGSGSGSGGGGGGPVARDGFRPWSKRGQASLSPSGRGAGFVAATGDDGGVGLWAATGGEWVRLLQGGHPAAATALAWAPDGRRLVTADADGGVAMWQ